MKQKSPIDSASFALMALPGANGGSTASARFCHRVQIKTTKMA